MSSSSSNRIRLTTHPPLSPLRAWVPFDQNRSILDLKSSVLDLLIPLSSDPSISLTTHDLILESDGFAFLDHSLCSLIDPLHDLIDVKVINKNSSSIKKPNPNKSKPKPNPGPTQKQPNQNPKLSTIKAIDQDSQVLDSILPARIVKPLPKSSVHPQQNASKPVLTPARSKSSPPASQVRSSVPPGQGSSGTKARNKRKRLKKLYERQRKQARLGGEIVTGVSTEKALTPKIKDVVTRQVLNHAKIEKAKLTSQSSQPQKSTSQSVITQSQDSKAETTEDESSSLSEDSESSTSSSESSDSESDSSAPSSASVKPPVQPVPLPQLAHRTVPTLQDPQLNMLSFSNKNKRKNLKRGPHVNSDLQPSKIVFGSSPAPHPRLPSPVYNPPSPNRASHQPPSGEDELPPMTSKMPLVNRSRSSSHLLAQETEQLISTYERIDPKSTPSHGPPPSLRHSNLIPFNVVITSVDVLDPNWEPGQIGQSYSSSSHLNSNGMNPTTTRKKRSRNRRKRLKRNRRAAKSMGQFDNQEQSDDDHSADDGDDEIVDDVEAAYADFVSSGGHAAKPNEDDCNGVTLESKKISDQWDQLPKATKTSVVQGDRIAVRVIELSLDSLTPETMIYHGTLSSFDLKSFTIKLDQECKPSSILKLLETNHDQQEQNDHEDEDETMIDFKSILRSQQVDCLLDEVWDHQVDQRTWEWDPLDSLDSIRNLSSS